MTDELIKRLRTFGLASFDDRRDAADLIEQQSAALEAANARIAELESERDALLAAAGKEAVKITEPAQVAGSVFRAGISCDTVIKAAQRNYKYRNDPAVQDYPDRFTLAQIQAMDSIVPQGDREFVSLKDYQAAALEKGGGRDAVTDAQVEAALAAFNAFPCPENGSVVRTWDTDQMRAALLAALAQPLEAQADARWQPIDTAPKFGEPIDVWGRYGRKSECVFGKPTYAGGLHWIYEAGYDSNGPVFEIVVDPTHWMPPPAAPATANDKEKQS